MTRVVNGAMDRPLFSLLLHAHLPFVRHPEHADFLEERWLFEAIIECYLPLVRMLDGWERDGIAGVINLTVSPTLAAMLSDDLLRCRFEAHLARMEALGRSEEDRHALQPAWAAVARHYAERLAEAGIAKGGTFWVPGAAMRGRDDSNCSPAPRRTRSCRCCWRARGRCGGRSAPQCRSIDVISG